jgi:hypothetical protein
VVEHLASKGKDPSTTKKMGNGDHTEKTHAGLKSAVEPLWWYSVLHLSIVYSCAFQTVLRIKIWAIHWCWGIHWSIAMPGKDSTALDIELALDESLTPFQMSLCSSEPFTVEGGGHSVCGGPSMKFPGLVGSSSFLKVSHYGLKLHRDSGL